MYTSKSPQPTISGISKPLRTQAACWRGTIRWHSCHQAPRRSTGNSRIAGCHLQRNAVSLSNSVWDGSILTGSVCRCLASEEKIELFVLYSLLRLGKKYQVEDVFNRASKILHSLLPEDPNLWDEPVVDLRIELENADLILLANVARELGLPILHPRIVYKCCYLPMSAIVHGVQHSRGMFVRLAPEDTYDIICAVRIFTTARTEILNTSHILEKKCLSQRLCQQNLQRMSQRARSADVCTPSHALLPFRLWKQVFFRGTSSSPEELCTSCETDIERTLRNHWMTVRGGLLELFDQN